MGDVGTHERLKGVVMIQTIFSAFKLPKKVNLRMLLTSFLIITIAFDYTYEVHAAYNSTISIYVRGASPTSATNVQTFNVLGESMILYSSEESVGDYYTTNMCEFDLALPLNLYSSIAYSTSKPYQVTGRFYFDFYIKSSDGLSFTRAFCDPVDGASVTCNVKPFVLDSGTFYKFSVSVFCSGITFIGNLSDVFYLHFIFDRFAGHNSTGTLFTSFDVYRTYTTMRITDDNIVDGSVESNVGDIADQIEHDREEDRDNANQGGSDATDLAGNLSTGIKSKWAILWYPIDFTKDLLSVFTGGTASAAYDARFNYISGYSYDDESGTLVPIYDYTRTARSAGAVITFPSFEMLGYTIWDSYDFDLSTIKDDLPLVFDSIYVAISILELYWFVGFLRDKYEEVFG